MPDLTPPAHAGDVSRAAIRAFTATVIASGKTPETALDVAQIVMDAMRPHLPRFAASEPQFASGFYSPDPRSEAVTFVVTYTTGRGDVDRFPSWDALLASCSHYAVSISRHPTWALDPNAGSILERDGWAFTLSAAEADGWVLDQHLAELRKQSATTAA